MHEYSIYDAIEKISVRTGMYIWDRSLQNIGSYIYGYAQAMEDAGVKEVTWPRFKDFRGWLKSRFCFASDAPGWEKMILALAVGCDPKERMPWDRMSNATEEEHSKSIELFFSLIKEYQEESR